jgi:hypothetical protein
MVQFLAGNPLFGCTTLHHHLNTAEGIVENVSIEEALLSSPNTLDG